MKASIGGVDIFVMAYACSSKGVAYMVSSRGKTVIHKDAYVSLFEDEFGNVMEKELPGPTIAHMLYEFLCLIDEHNKTRQNALALESAGYNKELLGKNLDYIFGDGCSGSSTMGSSKEVCTLQDCG